MAVFRRDWRYRAFIDTGVAEAVGVVLGLARKQADRRQRRLDREAELKARWVLRCAVLCCAVLCCAVLCCAVLHFSRLAARHAAEGFKGASEVAGPAVACMQSKGVACPPPLAYQHPSQCPLSA